MKADELMIGDWVKVISTSELIKITEIIECLDDLYDVGCEEFRTTISNITPIPLTEDILKVNGWVDADPTLFHGQKYIFIYGEEHSLTLNHWVNFYTFNIAGGDRPLKYVHELQHALRLCGLNELADNLKLT